GEEWQVQSASGAGDAPGGGPVGVQGGGGDERFGDRASATELAGEAAMQGASSSPYRPQEAGEVAPVANPAGGDAGGAGETGYGGYGGYGGGVDPVDPVTRANKGEPCADGKPCPGDQLMCDYVGTGGGSGYCACQFPWKGEYCSVDSCLEQTTCDACRELTRRAPISHQFVCVWEPEGYGGGGGGCRSVHTPLPPDAFDQCPAGDAAVPGAPAGAGAAPAPGVPADAAAVPAPGGPADAAGTPAVPAVDSPQQAPLQLWYAAGLPILFIVVCGGLLMSIAKCLRRCSRSDPDGPDYTPVKTANAADSSGGEWGWDGD
ncbi:unnamed protein product, partial [Scytosiphon promiscuus]